MRTDLLVIMMAVLLVNDARATVLEKVELTCPVSGTKFEVRVPVSTNNMRGRDRDFLQQAMGTQPLLHEVWTCPSCHYSGQVDDFRPEAVTPELVKKIQAGVLVPPKVPGLTTGEAPAWARFELMAQVRSLQPGNEATVGRAYLKSAQAVRLEELPGDLDALFQEMKALADARMPEPRGENPYDMVMNGAKAIEALAQDAATTPGDRDRLLLCAGYLYHMRGEEPDARRVLAGVSAGAKQEARLATFLDTLTERIDRAESGYAMAADHLERAKLVKNEDQYLLGEVLRKARRNEEARAILEPLATKPDLDAALRLWVVEALERAKATR